VVGQDVWKTKLRTGKGHRSAFLSPLPQHRRGQPFTPQPLSEGSCRDRVGQRLVGLICGLGEMPVALVSLVTVIFH
jgi:hypothetical protein